MVPKEILNLASFFFHFILYLHFKCVDPDPYSEYGSGFRKLLNTDPTTTVLVFLI